MTKSTVGYSIEQRKYRSLLNNIMWGNYRVVRNSDGSVVSKFHTVRGAQRWIDSSTWIPVDHG